MNLITSAPNTNSHPPAQSQQRLSVGPTEFIPQLVIFDKDGTLIDFHAMWGSWICELTRRLEAQTGKHLAAALFRTVGYEPETGRILAHGALALAPLGELQRLLHTFLISQNLSDAIASEVLQTAWFTPDPTALAHPLTDLHYLFSELRKRGIAIAIATSDEHISAAGTLDGLGLTSLVDIIIGADDVVSIKPAPDMVLRACHALGIAPASTVMVGDNVADLQMGRAARVGLNIGVLSGLGTTTELAPYADILLETAGAIL